MKNSKLSKIKNGKMAIINKQLRQQVRNEVEVQFDTYITDRINILKNFGIEADYDDVFDRIVEKMMSGYDTEGFRVLDGNDEYDFEVLDFWSYIADFPYEQPIDELIKYLDDNYMPQIDNCDNTYWIIEDIARMYDEDSEDLYKNGHFDYCDSYMGVLYLKTHGGDYIKFDAENLEDYSDNMEQAIDEISAEVEEFDIDDIFNSVMIDMGWTKRYLVNYEEMKVVEKNAKEEIKKELNKQSNKLSKELIEIDNEIGGLQTESKARECLEEKKQSLKTKINLILDAI